MCLNDSYGLIASVMPINATNQNMNWKSSNLSVATVNNGGMVTAQSAGTATITATATDGSGKSASCPVTVLPYSLSEASGQVTITKYWGNDATVTIPATIGGKPAVAIGTVAFKSNTTLTEVTIPGSIKNIGEKAFSSCSKLNKLNFAEGTDDLVIEKEAFDSNSVLTTITLPKRLVRIEEGAFHNCNSLANMSFAADSQLTSIGKNGFSECPITSIDLPAHLQTIWEYAFYHNHLTGTLTIPATVVSIGESAFEQAVGAGATPLTTLNINDGAGLSIGKAAFKCHGFTTITIPDAVIIDDNSDTMGMTGASFKALYHTAGSYGYDSGTSTWTK